MNAHKVLVSWKLFDQVWEKSRPVFLNVASGHGGDDFEDDTRDFGFAASRTLHHEVNEVPLQNLAPSIVNQVGWIILNQLLTISLSLLASTLLLIWRIWSRRAINFLNNILKLNRCHQSIFIRNLMLLRSDVFQDHCGGGLIKFQCLKLLSCYTI